MGLETDDMMERKTRWRSVWCAMLLAWLPAAIPGTARAEAPHQPQGIDLLYLYYKVSGVPVPWGQLAQSYTEYRAAKDEFERQELMAKLRPLMEKRYALVAEKKSYAIRTGLKLEEYDFGREAYPLSLRPTSFFPFQFDYRLGKPVAITFANGAEASEWKIAKDEARRVAQGLPRNRVLPALIVYAPEGAREDRLNHAAYRIVEARILRIEFMSPDGRHVIGTHLPAGSTGAAPEPPRDAKAPPAADPPASAPPPGAKRDAAADPCAEARARGINAYTQCRMQLRVQGAKECIEERGATACENRRR